MQKFFSQEWAPGIVLTAAAVAALCIANSPLRELYAHWLALPLGPAALHLHKPIILWVNDALMAVFFFLVGLEIKREILVGELSSPRRVALPLVAAAGGMAVPATIYVALNHGDATALRGWAIPSATDIAFALGVLSLIGSRAPASLKVFLTAVAIIDDLGAVLIIAFFYTEALSLGMLGGAAVCAVALLILNLAGVRRAIAYLAVGAVMWFCVLKSGVHPTLAGVATALAIPLRGGAPGAEPMLDRLEHALKPWVNFLILPVFAFANAGLEWSGMAPATFTHSITLGIVLGLVVGKALGIFGTCWGLVRLGWAELPAGASQTQLFGVACLCGIGFTMSLFIGTLAFGDAGEQANLVKLGVMGGSVVSAAAGATILMRARGSRP
jgi:NhaA family Na+:H+ antiporter